MISKLKFDVQTTSSGVNVEFALGTLSQEATRWIPPKIRSKTRKEDDIGDRKWKRD